ncbi:MAG: hypothetical protein ACRDPW_08485 [Mycobacteriales bacterium]
MMISDGAKNHGGEPHAGRNAVLAQVLQELGWSHSTLVAALSDVLGRGYVGRSTVSEWVNHSRVPRGPLPTVIAHLLSEAGGHELSIGDLWGDRATAAPLWSASLDGVGDQWGAVGTADLIADWVGHAHGVHAEDRRNFLATWGRRLTTTAWSYVDNQAARDQAVHTLIGETEPSVMRAQINGYGERRITEPMVAIYSGVVARLRRFDDHEGGSLINVAFVHRFLTAIGRHLHAGDAESDVVESGLLRVWMQLCQIAGWMAYDAEQHGLAQRYFLSTLHAARALQDSAFGAHALAHLTHQAIYLGKKQEAIELANAAAEAAKRASFSQRALITSLLAHTEALSGNAHGFHSCADRARSLLDHPAAVGTRPEWLYWFDEEECSAKRGHALLALSRGSSRNAAGWLAEAVELLRPRTALNDTAFPREAVYNRLWLARGFLWRADVEQALQLAGPTLARNLVRSPRSVTLLRALDADLAKRPSLKGQRAVTAFRAELAAVLHRTGT